MSRTNSVLSKSLGNIDSDEEFYQARAEVEEGLRADRNQLDGLGIEIDTLRQELDANPLICPDQPLSCEAVQVQAKAELTDRARHHDEAERYKEAFRTRHGLCRQPLAAAVSEGLLSLGFIGCVESGVNAGFFLTAHLSAGPTAALLTSALISFTNLAVSATAGFFFGRGWRYGRDAADHDDPEFRHVRWSCYAGTALYTALIGFFHLSVGCIRAQETLAIEHGLAQYQQVFTTPESLFLTLTGTAMSALAWSKARGSFSDPYPGYSAVGQAAETSREALYDAFDDATHAIETAYAEQSSRLAEQKSALLKRIATHNAKVGEHARQAKALERGIETAERELQHRFAQIHAAQQLGRGPRASAAPAADWQHLISFGSYRPEPTPALIEAPDFTDYERRLEAAKADAMRALTRIFEQAVHPATQGDPA